ncbi:tRNA (guanine-N1)-methyltransferase [Aureitalea sp. L0-47]|uniref:tRNA (guanine-N1)-methyltransferase n=1 Tax=Aureitalea sp. L0-47 TaxID=2816962 RepID=UPI0022380D3E|nr:tRNA (guanine-N1)-methyltransferase [Aureitalea sp. L0-47]MCW5520465.1 tRNA (guanine-N1)-methyltransferase [Aureitalea sp. L0-47]
MKRTITCLLVSLCCILYLSAQEASNQNSLEDQFTDVIDKSNSYQDFKVIKKVKINRLKQNVLDSVASLESRIDTLSGHIASQDSEISSLNQTLESTKSELATSREKEDGIFLFGMLLSKSTYNTILWSVIGILLLLLIVFIMRYRTSNSVTRSANAKLAEVEAEFEGHRQRSLEREQQIRRKLQDELNKQKKA